MNKDFLTLKEIENGLLQNISLEIKRDLYREVDWEQNCVLVYGERGVGKTYILLQKRKETKKGFYFSCDNHIVSSIGLFDFVFWVVKNYEEKIFFIDEIHKYSNWIVELKNIIDSFPSIQFFISGSNSITLYKGSVDLGRRIVDYRLFPLSFREFLKFEKNASLESFSFDDLIENYLKLDLNYISKINDVLFEKYLKQGYYPFGVKDNFYSFTNKINKLLDQIILEDMLGLFNFTSLTANKLKKLFYFLANNLPSEISINSLSKKIGVSDDVLGNLLFVLDKVGVVSVVSKYGDLSDTIRKQQKIFLGNPNLYFSNSSKEIGTIRESYFISQIRRIGLEIFWVKKGDYVVKHKDKEYRFEIGGKNKDFKQISGKINSFLAIDNLYSEERKIPLWMFGMLK